MPFVQDYNRRILDHMFMGAALAQPGSVYIGLSTTTPTASGGNLTEPVGGSYARVQTDGADWAAAAAGSPSSVENSAQIDFPTPTGSWGTVTYFTMHTALSGGSVIGFGKLTTAKAISSGDPVNFPVGALDFQAGAPADAYTGV